MPNSSAPTLPSFASLLQQFFTEYLVAQRAVSARTVACYRDALTLFLDFRQPQARHGTNRAAVRRHPARSDPGVPGPSGARAQQFSSQP